MWPMGADGAPPAHTVRRDSRQTSSVVEAIAWTGALIGYFGPWITGPAWGAALSWNAYDLFDLMRLLPDIETGALSVNLQTLHFPLLGLAILLPTLGSRPVRRWWQWASMGIGIVLALATLPPYPEIVTAWRTPGWRVPFWWAIACAGLSVLAARTRTRLDRVMPWIAVAVVIAATLPAARTLYSLLPAISRLHHTTVAAGWGFWVCTIGLGMIGAQVVYRVCVTSARHQKQ